MLRIELMPWDRARSQASPIRFTVFVEEQGVPREIELDEQDAVSVHALAFEGDKQDGKPVATGRLLPDGHIGRMAVLKEWRNRGVGGLMLQALLAEARRRGYREVVLSAQVHAAEFYERHGFIKKGEEYMEAGIRHQEMALRLL
jgi:predicted GNAT family N-acyltransferase